jgi:hypothetical protein
MIKEELLIPRIQCTEPFLGMQSQGFEPGIIYELYPGDDYEFNMSLPQKYPLNFKMLNWWEQRKIEDMPGYFKTPTGRILKVTKHFVGSAGDMFEYGNGQGWVDYKMCEISNGEEYNDFNNSK